MLRSIVTTGFVVGLLATAGAAQAGDCPNCWRVERTPAYYATTERRQVVRPATVRTHVIPARVVAVRETIGYEPPRLVRTRSIDSNGNVAWCEHMTAGRPITVTRHVVRPARIVHRHVPGEVHTLPHRVLVEPPSHRVVAASPRWRPSEPQPWW